MPPNNCLHLTRGRSALRSLLPSNAQMSVSKILTPAQVKQRPLEGFARKEIMDYIKFAIDELEKQNEKRGITAGMARQQYSALLSRIAQLESAQQSCGDSAPLQSLSTPEADTPAGHLSTPPTSG